VLLKENSLSERRHATGKYKQYLFHCRICSQDVWIRSCKLQSHSSMCYGCSVSSRTLRPFESTWNVLTERQERRNFPGGVLSYEEFFEFTKIDKCHYCACFIDWNHKRERGKRQTGRSNLDRIDSEIGYQKENLVVCCPRCNQVKSNTIPHDAMLKIGPILAEYNVEHFPASKSRGILRCYIKKSERIGSPGAS
jgi:hypothetical protein